MINKRKVVRIFCDMDQVLTDFVETFYEHTNQHYYELPISTRLEYIEKLPINFWTDMLWMKDGKMLWQFLLTNFENVYILSSPTPTKEEMSEKGKLIWLEKEGIINQISYDNIIITEEKHEYVKPKDLSILIDDNKLKINKWENYGGVGIFHKNTPDTIEQLQPYI